MVMIMIAIVIVIVILGLRGGRPMRTHEESDGQDSEEQRHWGSGQAMGCAWICIHRGAPRMGGEQQSHGERSGGGAPAALRQRVARARVCDRAARAERSYSPTSASSSISVYM